MSDSEEDIFAPKTATRCGREVKPAERFKQAKPAGPPQARSILDSCDFLSKVLLLLSEKHQLVCSVGVSDSEATLVRARGRVGVNIIYNNSLSVDLCVGYIYMYIFSSSSFSPRDA